jgi:Leucine-rich repeat (LRR) protein
LDIDGLTHLNLADCREITDTGVKHLQGFGSLISLSLSGCPGVTDRGIAQLEALTSLKRIFLDGTSVTPPGLRTFREATPNTEIHVDPATLSGFRSIGERIRNGSWDDDYNLVSLKIHETVVLDSVLEELTNRPDTRGIQWLELYRTTISERGMKHVADLKELESLSLGGTPVSAAGLAHISTLPNLRSLSLWGTQLTDEDLVHLKGMTNLEYLSLGTPITDSGLVHLTALQNLQRLDVSKTNVTAAGLQRLKRSLPELKVIGP